MFFNARLLAGGNLLLDAVHANSAFIDQISDHGPLLLTLEGIPTPMPELAAVMPCCPAVDVGRVGAGGAQGTARAARFEQARKSPDRAAHFGGGWPGRFGLRQRGHRTARHGPLFRCEFGPESGR